MYREIASLTKLAGTMNENCPLCFFFSYLTYACKIFVVYFAVNPLHVLQFRRRLHSVVVDGCDVIAAAEIAVQRSLSTFEAKSLEAKAKAKKEEERVAKLKKIRGERWLPSIARAMQRDMIASKKARVVGIVL